MVISMGATDTTEGDPWIFLGETLPTRNSNKKLNSQSAFSTNPLLPPIWETGDVIAHLQEPDFLWFTSNKFCKRHIL